MRIDFTLNGSPVQVDAAPEEMLLEVLREQLGLHGARGTCGAGLCGACTVLVDGTPMSSCILFAPLAGGCSVTTIEGLRDDDPLVQSFDRSHAFQCGFCVPGMVLTAKAMLAERECRAAGGPPGRDEVRAGLGGNLCRCGCYDKIVDAVTAAAARPGEERESRE